MIHKSEHVENQVVDLRERTRRQQIRSGDVPDHQEDHPGEDQPQDQVQ